MADRSPPRHRDPDIHQEDEAEKTRRDDSVNVTHLRAGMTTGEGHRPANEPTGAVPPAAAPLGTDAEAGGAPLSQTAVDTAYRHEAGPRTRGRETGGQGMPMAWIVVAILVIAALVFFFVL